MNKQVIRVLVALAALAPAAASASRQGALQQEELVLDGVIVAENPSHSIALVRRAGAVRGRPLRLGQQYGGYVLVEVTRGSALMKGRHGTVRLMLASQAPESAVAARVEPERPAAEPLWERRAFSRSNANRRLEKEMPVILSDTELTPKVVEGEVRGLELIRLPDGTVLSEAGLLPGDVLKSINGEPVFGIDSLWTLLARVADVDEIRVVVERRGEVVRLAYALTN